MLPPKLTSKVGEDGSGKLDLSGPATPSNIVAGRSLSLSGALGLNGQIPERLKPFER